MLSPRIEPAPSLIEGSGPLTASLALAYGATAHPVPAPSKNPAPVMVVPFMSQT